MCTKCAPGVHQDSCSPGVHQVCTKCAPGVHQVFILRVCTMWSLFTRGAPGVHWGVHQVCTRCAELHYQIANMLQQNRRVWYICENLSIIGIYSTKLRSDAWIIITIVPPKYQNTHSNKKKIYLTSANR